MTRSQGVAVNNPWKLVAERRLRFSLAVFQKRKLNSQTAVSGRTVRFTSILIAEDTFSVKQTSSMLILSFTLYCGAANPTATPKSYHME